MNFLAQRPRLSLILLGLAAECVYLLAFVQPFFVLRYVPGPYQDMGQLSNHSPEQFWLFLGAFIALFLLLLAAWRLVHERTDRGILWIILGLGCVFGLTMSFVYPVTANDVFGYIAQSLIMLQYHRNPIAVPPSAFPHDPLMGLTGGWASYTAAYGPLGLVIDALPTFAVHRDLPANLLLIKLMFSGMTVLCAYLVHDILRHVAPRQASGGALLVAWNPLILFEISANGHNDIAMMLFALLALLMVVEDSWTVGAGFLVVSALVKYAAIILLPLVVVYAISRMRTWRARATYLVETGALVVVITVIAYRPFWIGPQTFSRPLLEAQLYLYSCSSMLHNLFPSILSLETAAILGRVIFIPIYLYALWLASRSLSGLLAGCFLAMFSFLGLAVTNVKYWYIVWPAILGAVVPSTPTRLAITGMGWAVELAAALNVFVWVWLGVTSANFVPLNDLSYAAIFVLPSGIIGVSLVMDRKLIHESGPQTHTFQEV